MPLIIKKINIFRLKQKCSVSKLPRTLIFHCVYVCLKIANSFFVLSKISELVRIMKIKMQYAMKKKNKNHVLFISKVSTV